MNFRLHCQSGHESRNTSVSTPNGKEPFGFFLPDRFNVRGHFSRAFTLIEMLAVIVSMFVILSAATGFLVVAMLRQQAVLDATQLEARHSQLAEAISNAIKTADDFQIFESASAAMAGSTQQYFGRGVPNGNYLSCRHDDGANVGVIEQDFEFQESGTITQTTKFLTINQPDMTKTFDSARISQSTCFSMREGIPQAHWQVLTTLDRVDFNVYGMPLNLR
jgi:type II secretory pathway pseudopilin PulG